MDRKEQAEKGTLPALPSTFFGYKPTKLGDEPHFTHFYANENPAHARRDCDPEKCGEMPVVDKP